MGLLEEGEHQLKRGHVQGLDHGPRCRITVAAAQQVLPDVPPALVGKQLALVAAMQQGLGLGRAQRPGSVDPESSHPDRHPGFAGGQGQLRNQEHRHHPGRAVQGGTASASMNLRASQECGPVPRRPQALSRTGGDGSARLSQTMSDAIPPRSIRRCGESVGIAAR